MRCFDEPRGDQYKIGGAFISDSAYDKMLKRADQFYCDNRMNWKGILDHLDNIESVLNHNSDWVSCLGGKEKEFVDSVGLASGCLTEDGVRKFMIIARILLKDNLERYNIERVPAEVAVR